MFPRGDYNIVLVDGGCNFCVCSCFLSAPSARCCCLVKGRAGTHGPPPEMQLSLASLSAPKLGRAPGIADEQFAWDSREFLRKMCIGKQVCGLTYNTSLLEPVSAAGIAT